MIPLMLNQEKFSQSFMQEKMKEFISDFENEKFEDHYTTIVSTNSNDTPGYAYFSDFMALKTIPLVFPMIDLDSSSDSFHLDLMVKILEEESRIYSNDYSWAKKTLNSSYLDEYLWDHYLKLASFFAKLSEIKEKITSLFENGLIPENFPEESFSLLFLLASDREFDLFIPSTKDFLSHYSKDYFSLNDYSRLVFHNKVIYDLCFERLRGCKDDFNFSDYFDFFELLLDGTRNLIFSIDEKFKEIGLVRNFTRGNYSELNRIYFDLWTFSPDHIEGADKFWNNYYSSNRERSEYPLVKYFLYLKAAEDGLNDFTSETLMNIYGGCR